MKRPSISVQTLAMKNLAEEEAKKIKLYEGEQESDSSFLEPEASAADAEPN